MTEIACFLSKIVQNVLFYGFFFILLPQKLKIEFLLNEKLFSV